MTRNDEREAFTAYAYSFFWCFERRANAIFNFEILLLLHSLKNCDERLISKPMCMIIAAIAECTLYDFLIRNKQASFEGIPNMCKTTRDNIKNGKIRDILSTLNRVCRGHELLGREESIYDKIDELVGLRNRVHIQNINRKSPLYEYDLWNYEMVGRAYEALSHIYIWLTKHHPRKWEHCKNVIDRYDFPRLK